MSIVVVDAGVFIASVYTEALTTQAQQLLRKFEAEGIALHAPALLHYELVSVTRKVVHQGRVTRAAGERALDILLRYPVELHIDKTLLRRSYELATLYARPAAYDAQYLALAERLSCTLWTTDRRLVNTVTFLPHYRWRKAAGLHPYTSLAASSMNISGELLKLPLSGRMRLLSPTASPEDGKSP